MATPEERPAECKGQVPNEEFVYKTIPQQKPSLYIIIRAKLIDSRLSSWQQRMRGRGCV